MGRMTRTATASAVLCVLALAGCTGTRSESTKQAAEGLSDGGQGGKIVWGKPSEALTTDPAVSSSSSDFQIMAPVYETLVTVDQLKPVPQLATSWQQTSPTTYTFEIRKGVKFSNGRELTVDDVIGSLRRVMNPELGSPWAGKLGIAQVAASGPWQVKVTLKTPRSTFIPALANQPAAILPMKELGAGGFDPAKQMLGTGPYQVAEHRANESWTLTRNPHYWGEPAKAAQLEIRILTDDAARIAALRSGATQVAMFDPPDSIRLLEGQSGVKTVVQNSTSFYRIDINAKTSVFKDHRLRQAVALSVDRAKIAKVALSGVGVPTTAIAPSFEGVCDADSVPYSTPDAAKARALVQAAGATGKTVSIIASTANATLGPIAQVLQQDLQAAGLNVKILQLDNGEWIRRVYNGKTADFDLELSFFGDYADPSMGLSWWNPTTAGFSKPWFENDAQLNALIDRSETTPTGPDRNRVIKQACDRIAEGANIIPLVTKPNIVAYRTDRLNADIPAVEAYQIPLRKVAGFELN